MATACDRNTEKGRICHPQIESLVQPASRNSKAFHMFLLFSFTIFLGDPTVNKILEMQCFIID